MVTRKEYPDEVAYQRAMRRWRLKENERLWRIKNEKNPIIVIDDEEARVMPQTFSLAEMFYHPHACECGSCLSIPAQAVKKVRMDMRPIPPAIKSLIRPLPEVPHQVLPLLLDAVEEALSRAGSRTLPPEEQE